MYIYHVLINALSAHMIHINLNMIFYARVEHSPTETVYIKYYTENKHCTSFKKCLIQSLVCTMTCTFNSLNMYHYQVI